MPDFPHPSLPTLARKPTWCNRAGRIDRSACIELRASDIWRDVCDANWRAGTSSCRAASRSQARLNSRTYTARGRAGSHQRATFETSATFTITAPLLARLHDSRPPRQLAGDLRSRKSNAMKCHLKHHRSPFALNPNKGATRIKKLGVWEGCLSGHENTAFDKGWKQIIRIERWRLHDRLAQHFLICPRCSPPRKQLKLFMPLATKKEIADARLAEGWVRLVDAYHRAARISLPRELARRRARFIDRYCMLFQSEGGRELRCRKCLHMRYGEIKWKRHALRIERFRAANAIEDADRAAAAAREKQAEDERIERVVREHLSPEQFEALLQETRAYDLWLQRRDRENQRRNERRAAERAGLPLPDRRCKPKTAVQFVQELRAQFPGDLDSLSERDLDRRAAMVVRWFAARR